MSPLPTDPPTLPEWNEFWGSTLKLGKLVADGLDNLYGVCLVRPRAECG